MLRAASLLTRAQARTHGVTKGFFRGFALPAHQVLGLPALSPTMTQGNISKYLVKVGDTVQAGDRIAEIETDKATVDFDVVDSGTVAKILIPEGTNDVQIGTPMIVLADEPGDVDELSKADFGAAAPPPAPAPAEAPAHAEAPAPPAAAPPAPAPAPSPAPSPAASAPAPSSSSSPIELSGSLPTLSGRIYYNDSKGWYRA